MRRSTNTEELKFHKQVACVASVPVRSERNSGRAKEFILHSRRAKNGARAKKLEVRGWGRGTMGTLARKPLDFEKHLLVFTISSFID